MEIIVAAVAFKLELVIVAVSKKVVKTQRRVILFLFMRGSGVLNIPILSFSLLECFPAWPHVHLLNNGSYKPVCLFTTWLGKELSSAKITLPNFSFKLRIEQGRKLKQGSKKPPSGRPGQVDFPFGQVTFSPSLPDGQGHRQGVCRLNFWYNNFEKKKVSFRLKGNQVFRRSLTKITIYSFC